MKPSGDITRVVLLVLFIGLLLAGSLWTLLPFLGALIWAATVVIATWPLLLQLRVRTGTRPWLAVAIMTTLALLAVILPFAFAVSTLLDVAHRGDDVLREFLTKGLGPPPEWLGKIPAVGAQLVEKWQELATGGRQGLIDAAEPYMGAATSWAIAITGGIGMVTVNILLTIAMVGAIVIARRRVIDVAERPPAGREVMVAPATPIDDNPHSIPVYGTENPRAKAYPEA